MDRKVFNRTKIVIGSLDFEVLHLKQKNIGITVRVELGHFLLVDAKDCEEMFLLSTLFEHALKSNDVLYFERENDSYADLFVFNGAVHPLDRKKIKSIKTMIQNKKPTQFEIVISNHHDEKIWDTWENWRYDEQLRVSADAHLAMVNASKLGLELLFHQCGYLAASYSGHAHFDWHSTPTSIELIIRNLARN